MKNKLPKVGDEFEFDYTNLDGNIEVISLKVLDVTDINIYYKMDYLLPYTGDTFPMEHSVWFLNEDKRRPKKKKIWLYFDNK